MKNIVKGVTLLLAALIVIPVPVYAKNKKENRGRIETIRIIRMKYDCYLDASFKQEKKEYAKTDKEAEKIKQHTNKCVVTGNDVTDPKYVIRYSVIPGELS